MGRFLFLALVLIASCPSVRFCSRSRAFPLRLLFFLFFSSSSLGGRPGRGFLPCSPPPRLVLRSRARRCRQELAHESTLSFSPFSFPPSSPLSPSSRPASSPSRRLSLFLFFLASFSVFRSVFLFFDVALFCCCRSCYVMCGYWLLILDSFNS